MGERGGVIRRLLEYFDMTAGDVGEVEGAQKNRMEDGC